MAPRRHSSRLVGVDSSPVKMRPLLQAFDYLCVIITCDEKKPCTNCVKHSISCDYPAPKSASPSRSTSAFGLAAGAVLGTPNTPAPPIWDFNRTDLPTFHMDDLGLLHHYTTSTCQTLSSKPQVIEAWRITVPQVALSYDFLMRGLLAIAALHLAHLRPDQKDFFVNKAADHYSCGLKSFRVIMSNVTPENCNAFFAFSALVLMHSFASLQIRQPEDLNFLSDNPKDGSAEWVQLLRGQLSILVPALKWIKAGSLGPLMQSTGFAPDPNLQPYENDATLAELLKLCDKEPESEESQVYETAIAKLRSIFARVFAPDRIHCEVGLCLRWGAEIPQRFVSLLYERKPEALIILSYYCVLIKNVEHYWWLSGWAPHMLGIIRTSLGAEWHSWLEWPRQMIEDDDRSPASSK